MRMKFSVWGPPLAEKRLLLRSFTPGPELSWCSSALVRSSRPRRGQHCNSCSPAATPQELSREQIRDLQHEAGAPQQRLDDDHSRCPGGLRCAQHPDSHPFTSYQASLMSRQASNAAAAQTDRVGAGTDPIGRLEEELGQLGDASGQLGEQQEARR